MAFSDLPLVVERSYFETCIRGAEEHDISAAAEELRHCLDLELADAVGDIRMQAPPSG